MPASCGTTDIVEDGGNGNGGNGGNGGGGFEGVAGFLRENGTAAVVGSGVLSAAVGGIIDARR